jgi:glucose uptake protein
MALAFSVTYGVALTIATLRALLFDSPGSMPIAVAGAVLLLAAVVLAAYAYSTLLAARGDAIRQSGKRPPPSPGAVLPVTLGAVGGIALGLFRPLVEFGRATDGGLAPYGLALLFAVAILASTILLAPFFFNFPVAGAPIKFSAYLAGTRKQHALGLLGGILTGAAFLTGLLALSSPRNTSGLNYAISEGGPVLAMICGLLLWHEFKGAGERPRILSMVVLFLLAVGIALVAISRG